MVVRSRHNQSVRKNKYAMLIEVSDDKSLKRVNFTFSFILIYAFYCHVFLLIGSLKAYTSDLQYHTSVFERVILLLRLCIPTNKTMLFFLQHWNQLSRFQRNIILTIIFAIFVTLLLLIPGGSVGSDSNKEEENHIRIAPFKYEVGTHISHLKLITFYPYTHYT